MAAMMIGDAAKPARAGRSARPRDRRERVLTWRTLARRRRRREAVRGVELTVRAGEIVGIAGVSGNGQSELVEVLAGQRERPAARCW